MTQMNTAKESAIGFVYHRCNRTRISADVIRIVMADNGEGIVTREWHDDFVGRIESPHFWEGGPYQSDHKFVLSPGLIPLNTLLFCPCCGKHRNDGKRDAKADELWRHVEYHGSGYRTMSDEGLMILVAAMAFQRRHEKQCLISRCDGCREGHRRIAHIHGGPWLISDDPRCEMTKGEREVLELKRWLHGEPSSLDVTPTRRAIVAKAVRRRIMKVGLTAGELQFFQTMFSAAELGRWMKEKTETHEHNRNRNTASSGRDHRPDSSRNPVLV